MNEDELRRRLDALCEQAPDEDALLARWEKRSRGRPAAHRRTAPVLAVLVAATVVAVAGVALSGLAGRTSPEATDARRQESAEEAPAARDLRLDDDVREVGRGRVVVSVPESWSWEKPVCGDLDRNGYYFSIGIVRACAPVRSGDFTTVRVDSLSALPKEPGDPVVDRDLDGVAVGLARGADGDIPSAVILAPDEDVRIVVRGPAESVDAVVRSLRILPPGEVAVPELSLGRSDGKPGSDALPATAEMRRRLERVGLVMRLRALDGATKTAYSRMRVTPAPGSVVAVGSVVRVTLVGAGKRR